MLPFFFYLFPASIVLHEPATKMILLALRTISSGNLAVHCGQRRDLQIPVNPPDGARKR
jgi:hypothetical protein